MADVGAWGTSCGSAAALGIALIAVTDALDVTLCYGWTDGRRKAHDDVSLLQRYSRP